MTAIDRVYNYLVAAYEHDFGSSPRATEISRLRRAAQEAVEDYETSREGPIVISLPFIYVTDVMHPHSLERSPSRDEFRHIMTQSR